jgi:hypothetical protein
MSPEEFPQGYNLTGVRERTLRHDNHCGVGGTEDKDLRAFDDGLEIAPVVMAGSVRGTVFEARGVESVCNGTLIRDVSLDGLAGCPIEGYGYEKNENESNTDELDGGQELGVHEKKQ